MTPSGRTISYSGGLRSAEELRRGEAFAWREWSEDASPDLLAFFYSCADDTLREVRRDFPFDCGPGHQHYWTMRGEMHSALDDLFRSLEIDHALHSDS